VRPVPLAVEWLLPEVGVLETGSLLDPTALVPPPEPVELSAIELSPVALSAIEPGELAAL
jgi:hypothetical protein